MVITIGSPLESQNTGSVMPRMLMEAPLGFFLAPKRYSIGVPAAAPCIAANILGGGGLGIYYPLRSALAVPPIGLFQSFRYLPLGCSLIIPRNPHLM